MSHQRVIVALVVFVSLAAAGALLIPLPNEYRSGWLRHLLDLGHVPLFALLTVFFWQAFNRSAWRALGVSALIAGTCEIGQTIVGRSADAADFVRGLLGSLLAIVIVNAFESPLTKRRLAGHLTAATVLLAWPVADALPVLCDAASAYRSFPILCDFRTRWQAVRWESDTVTVDRVKADSANGGWMGRMQFPSSKSGAGSAVLFPVVRDWRGYTRLCCEFSFSGEPLSILISVRDGRKVKPPAKRFDLVRRYQADRHRVYVDLEALARGDEFSPLDLSRVQSFHIGLNQSTRPRTLFLHRISLE